MTNEDRAKEIEAKSKIEGPNIYYVPKDSEDGSLYPRAGLWESNGYGRESAEEFIAKGKYMVLAKVHLVELPL